MNGGAVTSFACSCSMNCFVATDRHADASLYKSVVQSPIEFFRGKKCNDVILSYVIIEMASLDNPSVRITGVPISKGPLYTCTYSPVY